MVPLNVQEKYKLHLRAYTPTFRVILCHLYFMEFQVKSFAGWYRKNEDLCFSSYKTMYYCARHRGQESEEPASFICQIDRVLYLFLPP